MQRLLLATAALLATLISNASAQTYNQEALESMALFGFAIVTCYPAEVIGRPSTIAALDQIKDTVEKNYTKEQIYAAGRKIEAKFLQDKERFCAAVYASMREKSR
jgi:hypothetical protein